jgi:hypothetical protein
MALSGSRVTPLQAGEEVVADLIVAYDSVVQIEPLRRRGREAAPVVAGARRARTSSLAGLFADTQMMVIRVTTPP